MASEIAEVVGGQLVGDDVAVNGATIDSRSVSTGQLFVPIVAARDGHDFISAALDAGAPADLTSAGAVDGAAGAANIVDDTARARAGGRGA